MMKRLIIGIVLTGLLVTMMGCAGGGMTRETEAGYIPKHVTVGDIFSYNRESSVSHEDIQRLATQFAEEAFYDQGLPYIPADEIENTPADPRDYIVMEMSLTFQQAYRQTIGEGGITVRCEYTLRRGSDNLIYASGSVNSSDWLVSSGASLDSQTAIQYACNAAAKEVKELIEQDKLAPAVTN